MKQTLITVNTVSRMLGRGYSPQTIRRGKIKPHAVLQNGTRLYLKSEIEKMRKKK